MAARIQDMTWMGLKIVGVFDDRPLDRIDLGGLSFEGNMQSLITRAKSGEIDVVYITLPMHAESRIVKLVNQLSDTTASVYVVPDSFVFDLYHARWSNVAGMPVVSVYESPFYGIEGWVKRAEDLILGSMILLFILPLMLIIGLGVKLTTPGSVIFKQRRYGLNGDVVEVWKFRSMTASDDGDRVVQATKNDTRVTSFGGFLRRNSLDELPQFINVLQGRMSIVGPRPHAVSHNEQYRSIIQGYMLRHKVRPGITGWAQINGWRGETDCLEKMQGRIDCDLAYVRNWTLWLDIKIIWMTFFRVFITKNVY
jgi:putative colanic acid biosynthesis UDP-glucose lipid carrier transferase